MEPEREPVGAGRERVLQLVAVAQRRASGDDRLERRVDEAADPHERVAHLVVLGRDLALVGEVLEAAAAARPEVSAGRFDPSRTGLQERRARRLGEAALHLGDAGAHEVARQPAAHEHDEAVEPPDAVPAVREGVDADLDLLPLADRCGHRAAQRSGTRSAGRYSTARRR